MIEKYQAAIDEIKTVCDKHGVVLIGTCHSEGIYGEISIGQSGDIAWYNYEAQLNNTVICYGKTLGFYVEGIGTVTK